MNPHDKNNLIVSICDANYVEQTKYLFGALRRWGNWSGDFCLVCNGLPEKIVSMFIGKKILVDVLNVAQNYNWAKVNVFDLPFTIYDRVLYLDQDMVVYGDVNKIFEQEGAFLSDSDSKLVRNEFECGPEIFEEMEKEYNCGETAFCAGLFRYDKSIVPGNMVSQLENIREKYKSINKLNGIKDGMADQPILNLFFAGRWQQFNNACYIGCREKRVSEGDDIVLCHTTAWMAPWVKESSYSGRLKGVYQQGIEFFEREM